MNYDENEEDLEAFEDRIFAEVSRRVSQKLEEYEDKLYNLETDYEDRISHLEDLIDSVHQAEKLQYKL